jgi:plasmid stabilization system protein ParE
LLPVIDGAQESRGRTLGGGRRIYDKAQLLRSFPDIGYRHSQVEDGEVRIVLDGHYRTAYLCRQDAGAVDILGVFHCTAPST